MAHKKGLGSSRNEVATHKHSALAFVWWSGNQRLARYIIRRVVLTLLLA